MRGTVRVEQASADKPYDLAVHVKNSAEIGYNPEVSSDRAGMAVALVKRYCPAARVVGQEKIITEIYGITSSKPDCRSFCELRDRVEKILIKAGAATKQEGRGDQDMRIVGILALLLTLAGCTGDRLRQSADEQVVVAI